MNVICKLSGARQKAVLSLDIGKAFLCDSLY